MNKKDKGHIKLKYKKVDFHSRLIRLLKIIIPIAALGLIGSILVWSFISPPKNLLLESTRRALVKQAKNIQVRQAQYAGVDEKGEQYIIRAKTIKKQPSKKTIFDLVDPTAILERPKGTIYLQAKQGQYNPEDKQLHLQKDLQISTDDGYSLFTQGATVDINKGTAWGKLPVRGYGPSGILYAHDGFNAYERGNHVIAHGKSRIIFYSKDKTPPISTPKATLPLKSPKDKKS